MIMQLEHIGKSFGARTLFSDVSFKLQAYDRLALVGPNGAGKTTLLNIISGQDFPDEGRVLFAKGASVGYLEQEAIEMGDQLLFEEVVSSQQEVLRAERRLRQLEESLGADPTEQQLAAAGRARDTYEALGGYTLQSKVRSVLFGLGFGEEDMAKRTTDFSGGWQMRIALAPMSCCSTSPPTISTSNRSSGWKAFCAATAAPSWSSATIASSWTTWWSASRK